MKLILQNRFKFILSCIFAFSILISQPIYAVQTEEEQIEEIAADTTEAALVAEEEAAIESDDAGTTTTEITTENPTEETASTAKVSSSSTPKVGAAKEIKKTDPQVYMDLVYYIFLFLVICVIVSIVNRILSIYKLTQIMNGRYSYIRENSIQAVLFLIFLFLFLYGVYYSYDVWGRWSFRAAATEHGKKIDVMFIITTIITTFVLIVMHILILGFTYAYRMKANRKAYYYPHNNTIEKIWTIVPATVLTILVMFGFFTWREITNIPEDLQKSAIQIEVLGEQFSWHVRYPGADGEIGKRNYKLTTPTNPYGIDFTDKNSWDDIQGSDIVIPVNRSVRFHILSKDILHSFYIPDFRVQMNAVPGMTNYFQFTPTMTTEEMREKMDDPNYDYVMLCAKICGSGHYNMQKKVVVVTDDEYKDWLSKQNKYFTDALQKEFAAKEQDVETNNILTASLN